MGWLNNSMNRLLCLFLLLTVTVQAQFVPYQQLGTNSFFTNSFRVDSKHWTNDPGVKIPPVLRPVFQDRQIWLEEVGTNYVGIEVSILNTNGVDTGYVFYGLNKSTNSNSKGPYWLSGQYGGVFESFPSLGAIQDGDGLGALGVADGLWSRQIGVAGTSIATANTQTNVGIHATALSSGKSANVRVGVYAETSHDTKGAITVPLMSTSVIQANSRDGDNIFRGQSNNVDVFKMDNTGDLVLLKSLIYNWPTVRGGANSVLMDTDNSGTLKWSNAIPVIAAGTNMTVVTNGTLYTVSVTALTNTINALITNGINQNSRIGPGTNNFIAKFNVVGGTNVGNSPLWSGDTNYVWLRQSAATGGTYTNSATNRIYSAETANAGTNAYLEFVAAQPLNNEAAHIRYVSQLPGARAPIYMNDSWFFEPNTNQGGGHAAGFFSPLVTDAGGSDSTTGYSIGSSSAYVKALYVNKIQSVARGDGPLYGSGVAGIVIYPTTLKLGFNGGTAPNQFQYNANNQNSPCLDIGGSYLATGISPSNSFSYIGGDGQLFAQLGSTYYGLTQFGTNNTGSAVPQHVGIIGAPGVGTDKQGADVKIIGGPSSGTGTNGDVAILTSEKANASSTTINSNQKTRFRTIADPIILTTNSATTVFSFTVPTTLKATGVKVIAHTEIENGVDICATDETFLVNAVNKAATVTAAITVPAAPNSVTVASGGSATIANTWTTSVSGTRVDVQCKVVTGGINSTNSTCRVTLFPNGSAVPVITHP